MALRVLKQQAETPVQAQGSRPFPKGRWVVEILPPTGSRTRPTPDFMHNADSTPDGKTPRVAGETGEITSVWFGNAEPLAEGQDSPGKQIFFQDFVTRDGIVEIMELDTDVPGEAGWQIQRDARLLANLAISLGATTNKGEYVEVADNFVELLQRGDFDGKSVDIEVRHGKPYKTRTGETKVDALIVQFRSV